MLPRCPKCARGKLWTEGGRLVCLACGYVARDTVATLERLASNLANDQAEEDGRRPDASRDPGDLDAALERARTWGA